MDTEVNSLFEVHILNAAGLEKAQYIAHIFDNLYRELGLLTSPSREFSIVKTKLEEAAFYAKKSMAQQTVNQLPKDTPAVSRFDYKDGGSLTVYDRPSAPEIFVSPTK